MQTAQRCGFVLDLGGRDSESLRGDVDGLKAVRRTREVLPEKRFTSLNQNGEVTRAKEGGRDAHSSSWRTRSDRRRAA